MWLNYMFNRKDESRVKEVGADRAASEWIIRNGGKVKFSTSKTWQSNFSMVTVSQNAARLVAIHADEASLTDNGFEHLVGLHHLEYLSMNSCQYIMDLTLLSEVAHTLKHLDIGNCGRLSNVSPVTKLKLLEKLVVTNTLGGERRQDAIQALQKALPDCEIVD